VASPDLEVKPSNYPSTGPDLWIRFPHCWECKKIMQFQKPRGMDERNQNLLRMVFDKFIL
jgi:hypothetical protein